MTDLNGGFDVEDLERLQALRRAAVTELAALWAFKEVWDARRKSHRSLIGMEIELARKKELGEKYKELSAAALEALASGDPRHVLLIDTAERNLTRLQVLQNTVNDMSEKIDNRRALLYALGRELRTTS